MNKITKVVAAIGVSVGLMFGGLSSAQAVVPYAYAQGWGPDKGSNNYVSVTPRYIPCSESQRGLTKLVEYQYTGSGTKFGSTQKVRRVVCYPFY